MQISLKLTPPQLALLRCLSRGTIKTANALEKTATRILIEGMQREAKLRRISLDRVGAIALVAAVERRGGT